MLVTSLVVSVIALAVGILVIQNLIRERNRHIADHPVKAQVRYPKQQR